MRFTDWLREQGEPEWTQMMGHPFIRQIADGSLPGAVFARYLSNEYSFVDTSATVLGYAIARAPSMAEKARLAEALRGLTTVQREFFQRALPNVGSAEELQQARGFDPAVLALREFALRVAAHGGYEETLVGMLAAEWMYMSWCLEAIQQKPATPIYREWIQLHTEPPFTDHVEWMRGQLDALGPSLIRHRQQEVVYIFARMLELEVDFHHAPYRPPKAR